MNIKMRIGHLDQGELEDLLAGCLYDSPCFRAEYDRSEYESINNANDDCPIGSFEGELAFMLLNGKPITIVDMEGSFEKSKRPFEDGDDGKRYQITLKDIEKGLGCKKAQHAVAQYLFGDSYDMWTMFDIIQCILWGRVIYG